MYAHVSVAHSLGATLLTARYKYQSWVIKTGDLRRPL